MLAVLFVCAFVSMVKGQDINLVKNLPKYDARYDYLNVEAILDNKRLVQNYVDCLINIKPCTPEGKLLRRILPEALRTKCVRCTNNQKLTAVKVIKRLKADYPENWNKLQSRWDPTGDFTRYFEEFLTKDTFNTIPNSGIEFPESSSDQPQATRRTSPVPPPAPTFPNEGPAVDDTTSPLPAIFNRFGDGGELLMGSPSEQPATVRLSTPRPTSQPAIANWPTRMTWVAAASDVVPTRFPVTTNKNIPPPITTAMTFLDQIGIKLIRTTELVTDILKNTVRAVVMTVT